MCMCVREIEREREREREREQRSFLFLAWKCNSLFVPNHMLKINKIITITTIHKIRILNVIQDQIYVLVSCLVWTVKMKNNPHDVHKVSLILQNFCFVSSWNIFLLVYGIVLYWQIFLIWVEIKKVKKLIPLSKMQSYNYKICICSIYLRNYKTSILWK